MPAVLRNLDDLDGLDGAFFSEEKKWYLEKSALRVALCACDTRRGWTLPNKTGEVL
jgi:hypothetical protein